jgi:glycine/D-amino acid oxidase-like deaminating enzyme
MPGDVLAPDFQERPFWTDGLPGDAAGGALPARADVLVVGAGMTGLSAAHRLASAGRSVLVLDAGEPGAGASSRNAGMMGKAGRQSFLLLAKEAGRDHAIAYFKELDAIFRENVARITGEGLACDFRLSGRFVGALSPEHYARLAREYEARGKFLGEDFTLVPEETGGEMGSPRYFGGVVLRDSAALNPALYTRGLLARARAAGATVLGQRRVAGLVRDGAAWIATTGDGGRIAARDVLLATNGYTDGLVPFANRRLLPINAYMVATEPLRDGLAARLLPNNRTYIDSTRATRYMQLSADGRRLLFGAKSGRRPPHSLKGLAREIQRDMVFLLPELEGVRLSHAWTGRCAATWDLYPHVGVHDGIHYAIGYCFGGLAFAPYLGRKAAEMILGSGDAETAFSARGFPEVPLRARLFRRYTTPLVTRYYAWADRPAEKAAKPSPPR